MNYTRIQMYSLKLYQKLNYFDKILLRQSSSFSLKTSNSEPLDVMPREMQLNQELRKIRLKIKENAKKYPPGIITLQVLGSGAIGAAKSLYVFTDQSRYLFNCGEGTQRLAHEHKMRLSKLEHIFITSPVWENLGGLPGVSLTIQDVGVPEITLHAPEGTTDLFPATKRFVVLKDLVIKSGICLKNTSFEDSAITIRYVPIQAERVEGVSERPDNADDSIRNNLLILNKSRIPQVCLAFICKLKTRPGSLNLQACVAKGVPPGPLLGQLKNGEDVILDDGTIVKSSDVTEPDDPGPLFYVVECPSEDYLNNFVTEMALFDEKPFAIIHFTPSNVMKNAKYQLWMSKFDTEHVAINDLNNCMGSLAVHRIQHKLNLIHPSIFPLLDEGRNSESLTNVINGNTFASLQLRPLKGLDLSNLLIKTPNVYREEPYTIEGFEEELRKFKTFIPDDENQNYPKITFLGTGSCIPNKTRNTSAIFMELSETTNIILDCGEGTFGQIMRFYGKDSKVMLKNLKMIYVSHLHADHHIGLLGILKGRRKILGHCEPLYLIAPKQIMFWLNFYHQRFEDILQEFILIPNDLLLKGLRTDSMDFIACTKLLNLVDIATVYVRHCPNSFGVSIKHNDGWKITYSGDTMPCEELVALGKDSDILIHEATMEDELAAEAKIKYHSTTSEAIEIGRAMNAKFVILTHFSQRYAKLPRLNQHLAENVGIAFDNMRVSFKDLPLLTKMREVLKIMFSEDVDELEARAVRRNLRAEKKRAASQSPPRSLKVQH